MRGPKRVPRDIVCRTVYQGDAEVVLLSYTPSSDKRVFTEAEREILLAIRKGLSNSDIAKTRQSSARTVANQVTGVLRKVGMSSRAELVAKLSLTDILR
jgi:DNA-binding NarL/FixJ family response regulator